MKKKYIKAYHKQTDKASDKGRNLKSNQRKTCYMKKKIRMKVDFWSENNSNEKKEEHCLSY